MRIRVFAPALLIAVSTCLALWPWHGERTTPTIASPVATAAPTPYGASEQHNDVPTWTGRFPTAEPETRQRGRVEPAAAESAREYGAVPVIVTLATGWTAKPDGAPDLAATQASVAAASDRVLAAVPPSEFSHAFALTSVPAISGVATVAGVQALASHPDVLRVSLNRRLSAQLEQAVPAIGASEVHTFGITGEGATVAVLDTGIDSDHPMLADSLAFQQCFLSTPEGGACPGGVLRGPTAEDDNGHGTHVSGIITSNAPKGVAPDAMIGALKVLDASGGGETINVLLAYDYIINEHPEVDLINMSISDGGSYPVGACEEIAPALTEAIALTRAMGITTFAASGNGGAKSGVGFPACVKDVVAVGATYDSDVGPGACGEPTGLDIVPCFSQSGANIDLLAPGFAITSAAPGGGTATLDGTSMSSPMAAGVAALLFESEPALTPAEREARLIETGVPVLDPANGVSSCRVDALQAIMNDGGPICAPILPPAPANDHRNDATEVVGLPYEDRGSTFGATMETDEPTSCGRIGSTVWYRYTPPVDASVLVSTIGSGFDVIFTVFREEGGALAQVACRASGAPGRLVSMTGGVTYLIQAGGFIGASGDLVLSLSEVVVPACPTAPSYEFATADAAGDTFGTSTPIHDIISVAERPTPSCSA